MKVAVPIKTKKKISFMHGAYLSRKQVQSKGFFISQVPFPQLFSKKGSRLFLGIITLTDDSARDWTQNLWDSGVQVLCITIMQSPQSPTVSFLKLFIFVIG